jgi:predicted  nucleic acid-binding Zn-ribbon protein
MPHVCTRCNNVFHKGEDILKGCPVCGWKKFLFTRKDPVDADALVSETTITRAMGVRMPPRAELIVNDGKIGEAKGLAIAQQAIPRAMVQKEEIKPLSLLDQAGPEAKDEDKVESIRITAPGTYELNLPSLFEREELIMAVKEGTYLIDLTSAFRKSKKE